MISSLVDQPGIDPDRVAIYIRWSTDDQTDGTTLQVQMEGCRHYILSQGWNCIPDLVFVDDGYSGATLDRPAMAKLRAAAAEGRVDCVVVYKIDRLSRNVVDTVKLVLEEWGGRCHVKSAREAIDTTDQQGKMFFYLLTSFAEWERSTIRDRTLSGRVRRAQEGKNPGFQRPYGYAAGDTPGAYVAVPGEAAVVRRIFEMYAHGQGGQAIAGTLNQEGLRFRGGRLWNRVTVMHILKNRAYIGTLVWGQCRRNRQRRAGEPAVLPNPAPVVELDGVLPGVVDRELFDLVQRVREERPRCQRGDGPRAWTSPHLLTGLLRCGRCGAAMIARKPYGAHKTLAYRCGGRREKGRVHCDAGFVPAPLVEREVVGQVRALYSTAMARERFAAGLAEAAEREMAAAEAAMAATDQALARVEAEGARLRKQYRDEMLTLAEYRELKADLEQEAAAVRQRRSDLERTLARLRAGRSSVHLQASLLTGVEMWDALDPVQRKRLLGHVVDSLRVYRPAGGKDVKVEVTWRVSGEILETALLATEG